MPSPLFIIGGEAIYRDALPLADLLFLTEIHREFEGDARFPDFDRMRWRETARESRRLDGDAGFAYDFASYSRLSP
jgi:dihydrofolate reductase